jgi:hypothetical protein
VTSEPTVCTSRTSRTRLPPSARMKPQYLTHRHRQSPPGRASAASSRHFAFIACAARSGPGEMSETRILAPSTAACAADIQHWFARPWTISNLLRPRELA